MIETTNAMDEDCQLLTEGRTMCNTGEIELEERTLPGTKSDIIKRLKSSDRAKYIYIRLFCFCEFHLQSMRARHWVLRLPVFPRTGNGWAWGPRRGVSLGAQGPLGAEREAGGGRGGKEGGEGQNSLEVTAVPPRL